MALSLTLPAMLVDAAWLAAHLDHPALRVLDATKYLPTDGPDGATVFDAGHIPHARFFDIDAFADPDTALPHMAPTAGRFARLAGAAGIGSDSVVVAYDQKGQASAARAWWLLRLFGHRQVALLDGGLPAWRHHGGAIETGPAAPATAACFTATLHARTLSGLGDVQANLATNAALILDARPAARFAGTAPEPRPGVCPGHIPGSRSLPAASLLDPATHRFLPPATLAALFASHGVHAAWPVITTCGTGVTAATLAFALELAGLPPASVYDGSWSEWGSRPDTRKQTGPA